MIHTLQRNWNVLTSIYNVVALLCASVTKCRFFIGSSKDAQVAVRHICIYVYISISHEILLSFKYAH